ncbi:hypothetical protein V4V24_18425 [Bacillus thuringiensis]|uniref:hypothetical protein n=1 Tax=Bacillus thuringiensis TaxID=1428 RepID=UPI002FBDD7A3
MITLDKRREVFDLWFIKRHAKREISRRLNISRGTIDKIINECQQKIFKLNLAPEADLLKHIEEIIVPPSIKRIRKPYKLNKQTVTFIKKIVIENEKLARLGLDEAKSIKALFEYLQQQKKENPNLSTDFTIDNFYKYVRKIREDIHKNGL